MSEVELFKDLTVLTLEQATTLPFLTYRLAQEGVRVIRAENPRRPDPNRFIGTPAHDEEGMGSYFLPNNFGKKAITLNLAMDDGRALFDDLIKSLPVDIFASNLKPSSYEKLGIDYERLRSIRPELIWLGITGFGPDHDEAAYDPILQARSGFMEVTGEPDGPPTVFGLPMVDLCASEHAFGQVMKALYRRAATGDGSRVDLSMFQSAVSFMVNPIMLTECFGDKITRRGTTHQFFGPVAVFPTQEGHIYLAVGNDKQWESFVGLPAFEHLKDPKYTKNAGRIDDIQRLNREIALVTRQLSTSDALELFREAGIPVARVNTVADVAADPLVRESLVWARDSRTAKEVCVAPPPVATDFLREQKNRLSFPPRLGEHNEEIYGEIGCDARRLAELTSKGVI